MICNNIKKCGYFFREVSEVNEFLFDLDYVFFGWVIYSYRKNLNRFIRYIYFFFRLFKKFF